MMSRMNESLLEMVYFFPIKEAFNSILGKKVNAIYKPSPQKEAWLGFDQAWTTDEVSEEKFYDIIKNKTPTSRFITYIMQFKVVEQQKHYNKKERIFTVPSHYVEGEIYYRSLLKTEPIKSSTTSQHELLIEIKNSFNFMEVYYACPMLFSQTELFKPKFMESEKDLREYLMDQLVLVDIASAPDPKTSSWTSSKKHHIMWKKHSGSDMEWCSTPKKGKKINYQEWIKDLQQREIDKDKLLENIEDLKTILSNTVDDKQSGRDIFSKLTIIEFTGF